MKTLSAGMMAGIIFNKGLVTYLPKSQAINDSLAKITDNQVYLGVDSVTKLCGRRLQVRVRDRFCTNS